MAARGKKNTDAVLLLALACGATPENAARKAEVSERTVQRRLADPAFQQQLSRVRSEMVQRAASMLSAAGMEAVKTLVSLLAVGNSGAVRLGAARLILECSIKLRETSELLQRLAALEAQLAKPAGASAAGTDDPGLADEKPRTE